MTPGGTTVNIGQTIREGGKDYTCADKGGGQIGLTIHSKTVSDTIIIQ
ncbi:hypothetical protein TELCIR_16682 [Teladorsagia circumcincta]|nr:hypothetical protein TELCIR_16682 [Teladorsagia circumcincta]